jgi:hypothetical protein
VEDNGARIEREVATWDGVTTAPHRFGGVEFRLGERELGHLHGAATDAPANPARPSTGIASDSPCLADLPFVRTIRDMLVETGRAEPHHVMPDSGWVSKRIGSPEDADEVIELFRLSYERARVAAARRGS